MSSSRGGFGLFSSLLLLVLVSLFWWQRQAVADWWRLQGYTPPANVLSLAGEDTMTPYAKHIFYVNHPNIVAGTSSFHSACPQSEQTIVLGCYHSNQAGIDVFDVMDSRLNGVEEVTAAHEMLHAAYDRLSGSERAEIDTQLEDFFNNDLHDQRVKDTINSYHQTEPGQEVNEMHSILGTEVSNLTPSLEAYYKKYFSNRSAVTTFASKYEDEFSSRVARIDAYDTQLASLKQQIESGENSLDSQLTQLQEDRARLDSLRSSGQLAEYNSSVSAFNAEVNQYNSAVSRLRTNIDNYNDIVTQRNAIASELRGLSNSIDTRLTTQSSQ